MTQVRIEMDEGWIWHPIFGVNTPEQVADHLKIIDESDLCDETKQEVKQHVIKKNTLTFDIPDAMLSRYSQLSTEWFELQSQFEQLYRQQEGMSVRTGCEIPDYRIKKTV